MSTPLLSIAVPVYNGEKFIKYCIESILCQEYTDFELLLIDDGSKDDSLKICREYEKTDARIRVIATQNGGASSTRNMGIENARGKYIAFIDSDDYIEKDHFKIIMDLKARYGERVVIVNSFRTVSDYERSVTGESVFSKDEEVSVMSFSAIPELHEKWLDASPCNKLYSLECIRENGLKMDESLSLGEDLLFNLDYLNVTHENKIVVSNKCTYNYVRMGNESLDNRYYPDMIGIMKRIHEALLDFVKSHEHTNEDIDRIYNAWFYKMEQAMKNTFNKKNDLNFFEKIKYNNAIMKSDDFKVAFEKTKGKLGAIYTIAYSSKSYFMVLLTDRLYSLKRKLVK